MTQYVHKARSPSDIKEEFKPLGPRDVKQEPDETWYWASKLNFESLTIENTTSDSRPTKRIKLEE